MTKLHGIDFLLNAELDLAGRRQTVDRLIANTVVLMV